MSKKEVHETNLPKGKYTLELNFLGDGRIFLNRWDYICGQDVVAEIKNGELYIEGKVVFFEEFLSKTIQSIKNGQARFAGNK